MDNNQTSERRQGWSRGLLVLVAIMCAVILMIHVWRWARGLGRWDDLLPSSGLLLLALPGVLEIKGVAKYVLQFTSCLILVVAIVMLSVRR